MPTLLPCCLDQSIRKQICVKRPLTHNPLAGFIRAVHPMPFMDHTRPIRYRNCYAIATKNTYIPFIFQNKQFWDNFFSVSRITTMGALPPFSWNRNLIFRIPIFPIGSAARQMI
jgi:hypothetical protein